MPSINNGHLTLKSWCWATFLFVVVIFVCPANGAVCQQIILYAKHMYAKLCTAVRCICCNQCLLWADNFVCWAHEKLCTRISLFCCSRFSLIADDSIWYWACGKLCSVSSFFAVQFLAFRMFLTADQPFIFDNYCNFSMFLIFLSFLSFRVSESLFCGDFHLMFQLNMYVNIKYLKVLPKCPSRAETQQGWIESPGEVSGLLRRILCQIR